MQIKLILYKKCVNEVKFRTNNLCDQTIIFNRSAWSIKNVEDSSPHIPYMIFVADRIDLLVADAHQANMGQMAVILAQFSGLIRTMNASEIYPSSVLADIQPNRTLTKHQAF